MKKDVTISGSTLMPMIPLRALVVFPNMSLSFDVGRKKSIAAIKKSMKENQKIFLVCQKDAAVSEPKEDDVFGVGVVCNVKQMIMIPNSNNMRVFVDGVERAKLLNIDSYSPYMLGNIQLCVTLNSDETDEQIAYARVAKKCFQEYASMIPKISGEVIAKMLSIKNSGELADFICQNTYFEYEDKQQILEEFNVTNRLTKLIFLLNKEKGTLEIEAEINDKVQSEIDKNQREYFLREEMKVIAQALGESENPIEEADEFKDKINALKCSDDIKNHLLKESNKLSKISSGSPEGTVIRNYLTKCLEIPFGKYTKDSINLEKARKILDKDHYGLEKVKERIVESLAVYKRNPDFSGQILCLAGPPGVGKTSVVKSLAKSMNRKYVRVALGGIHDEAEIRGHRKTYIGSMPGRIIEAVVKSGVMNPIILLDEIDKIGNDYKGDPSSALLEALDPEQNNTFTDHYIEFPVDLSKVLFITTANDTSAISPPLYDRMEIIELNSYTIEEKFHIAKEHLIKKEMVKHSLKAKDFKISNDGIYELIDGYTREAGVRNLQNQIAKLCRKATVSLENGAKCLTVTQKNIEDILGKKRFLPEKINEENLIGTVNGLAWTSVGGTMLPIEISVIDGTGKLVLTGSLGDVMQESAKTAVTYVRYMAKEFGIDSEFYKTKDIHIHAPEAAIKKDGPSAGLAITTALVSELTGIAIKSNVAMTGEISLKGKALAIGGLKEKSMAAYKAGCDTVIIPKDNIKDLEDISEEVKCAINFIGVSSFEEVIPIALESKLLSKSNEQIYVNNSARKQPVVTQ